MKIIIVGAGIGGLSTYLCLKKHLLSLPLSVPHSTSNHQIVIYEAYDIASPTTPKSKSRSRSPSDPVTTDPVFTPEAIGSAIGISANGINVLRRMAEDGRLVETMAQRAHPITRWEMSNARGWTLARIELVQEGKAKVKEGEGGSKGDVGGEGVGCDAIMISRQACWEVLRDEVVKDDGVVRRRKVVDVVVGGDGEEVNVVRFADGGEETADLVVGADGLRSVVRKAMFEKKGEDVARLKSTGGWKWWAPSTEPDYVTPHYEGLVGVGGFVPSSVLTKVGHPPGTAGIIFGPNGFFGMAYISSKPASPTPEESTASKTAAIPSPGPTAVFWSTFSSPTQNPFPLPNTSGPAKPYAFDKRAALSALLTRHRRWKNPVVQAILDFAEQDSSAVDGFYPTWTTPELPTWQKKGKCVLVGDAAHALQPSSGQGACQALEDAEALALLLKHYVVKNSEDQASSAATALEKFVALRRPRVHDIYVRSQQMSNIKADMGFVMEMVMYAMIWIMIGISSLIPDQYNEKLFNYDLPAEVEMIIKEK